MNPLDRLPHKAPALFLESVLEYSTAGARCSIARTLHPSLAKNGAMPACLGLEAMAQCAAVWLAMGHPEDEARGMLVQCRDFVMNKRYLDISAGLVASCVPVSTGSGTGLNQFTGRIEDAQGDTLCTASFIILAHSAK